MGSSTVISRDNHRELEVQRQYGFLSRAGRGRSTGNEGLPVLALFCAGRTVYILLHVLARPSSGSWSSIVCICFARPCGDAFRTLSSFAPARTPCSGSPYYKLSGILPARFLRLRQSGPVDAGFLPTSVHLEPRVFPSPARPLLRGFLAKASWQ